jgi:hypothetical protein
MVQVNVFIYDISAERLWEIEKPIPPVKVSTNLNVVGINKKPKGMLEVPFVFTINYTPSVAQISVKGRARIKGAKDELKKIHTAYTEKKPPPPTVIQSISNIAFLECVIISRTLRIPPPIPLPKIPLVQQKKKMPEPSYRA